MFNLKNRDQNVVNWQGARFREIDVSSTDYTTEETDKAFQLNCDQSGDVMVLGYLDREDETKKQLIHVVEGWNPCNLYKVYNDVGNTFTAMTAIY
jgi:hypothetical protein